MYLGIDLGTSGLKAILLNYAHRAAALASEPLTLQRPQSLWSEQDPDEWWAALERVAARLRHANAGAWAAVRAIGLSGQMYGAVVLDADQRVLRPAMLWNDAGSAARLVSLADGGTEADVCRSVEAARTFAPDVSEAALPAPRLERFRALYPALRDQFEPPPGDSVA